MKRFTKSRNSAHSGFTLIELLVVIAIISILASMLFPAFARARESARRTVCISDLKQIGLAINMYTQDYDERFPIGFPFWDDADPAPGFQKRTSDTLQSTLNSYIKNDAVWVCPSWSGVYGGIAAYSANYSFVTGSNNVIGVPETDAHPQLAPQTLAALGSSSTYPLLFCGIAPAQDGAGTGKMNAHNAQTDEAWMNGAVGGVPILYADGHAKAPRLGFSGFNTLYNTPLGG